MILDSPSLIMQFEALNDSMRTHSGRIQQNFQLHHSIVSRDEQSAPCQERFKCFVTSARLCPPAFNAVQVADGVLLRWFLPRLSWMSGLVSSGLVE